MKDSSLEFNKILKNNKIKDFFGIWASQKNFNLNDFPPYGWKIHIGGLITNASLILSMFLSFIQKRDFKNLNFKVINSLDNLELLNMGVYGFSQVGKMITIYPQPNEFCEVCEELHKWFKGISSVPITSDFQYKYGSNIFYRFGTLTNDKYGLDHRNKKFNPKKSPFLDSSRKRLQNIPDRYLLLQNLTGKSSFSSYLGLDLKTNKKVILRFSPSLKNINMYGEDDLDRLNNSFSFLSNNPHHCFERVIDSFYVHQTLSIVSEFIDGQTLYDFLLTHPHFAFNEKLNLFKCILNAFHKIHLCGYIFRDISFKNIMIKEGNVFIIDFDFITKINSKNKLPSGTYCFFDYNYKKMDCHVDYVCLASLLYYLFNFKEYTNFENDFNIKFPLKKIKQLSQKKHKIKSRVRNLYNVLMNSYNVKSYENIIKELNKTINP